MQTRLATILSHPQNPYYDKLPTVFRNYTGEAPKVHGRGCRQLMENRAQIKKYSRGEYHTDARRVDSQETRGDPDLLIARLYADGFKESHRLDEYALTRLEEKFDSYIRVDAGSEVKKGHQTYNPCSGVNMTSAEAYEDYCQVLEKNGFGTGGSLRDLAMSTLKLLSLENPWMVKKSVTKTGKYSEEWLQISKEDFRMHWLMQTTAPKQGERTKADARNVFIITIAFKTLAACSELAAKVFLELSYSQSITEGGGEKSRRIYTAIDYTEKNHYAVNIGVNGDATKWHVNMKPQTMGTVLDELTGKWAQENRLLALSGVMAGGEKWIRVPPVGLIHSNGALEKNVAFEDLGGEQLDEGFRELFDDYADFVSVQEEIKENKKKDERLNVIKMDAFMGMGLQGNCSTLVSDLAQAFDAHTPETRQVYRHLCSSDDYVAKAAADTVAECMDSVKKAELRMKAVGINPSPAKTLYFIGSPDLELVAEFTSLYQLGGYVAVPGQALSGVKLSPSSPDTLVSMLQATAAYIAETAGIIAATMAMQNIANLKDEYLSLNEGGRKGGRIDFLEHIDAHRFPTFLNTKGIASSLTTAKIPEPYNRAAADARAYESLRKFYHPANYAQTGLSTVHTDRDAGHGSYTENALGVYSVAVAGSRKFDKRGDPTHKRNYIRAQRAKTALYAINPLCMLNRNFSNMNARQAAAHALQQKIADITDPVRKEELQRKLIPFLLAGNK